MNTIEVTAIVKDVIVHYALPFTLVTVLIVVESTAFAVVDTAGFGWLVSPPGAATSTTPCVTRSRRSPRSLRTSNAVVPPPRQGGGTTGVGPVRFPGVVVGQAVA